MVCITNIISSSVLVNSPVLLLTMLLL
jgi:hypothetical protein